MAKKLLEVIFNDDISISCEIFIEGDIEKQVLLKALDSVKESLQNGTEHVTVLPICNCNDPNCKSKQIQRFLKNATPEQMKEIQTLLKEIMHEKPNLTAIEYEKRLEKVLRIMQGA